MAAFLSEVDIANRAMQLLGAPRIAGFTDHTIEAQESAFAYPRLRDAELRAHLWRFATRRTALYALGPSTYLWTPPTWASGTSYALGQVVVDADGNWWQSRVGSNTQAPPNTRNGVYTATAWGAYFGADSLTPFVAQTAAGVSAPGLPALASVSGGTLGPRTVYVKLTFVGAAGESAVSSEASLGIGASHLVSVTSPTTTNNSITGYNVYASDSAGNEILQTASPINLGTGWTEPTTGITPYGAAPPTALPASFFAGDLTYMPSTGTVYLSAVNGNTDTPPTTQWIAVNGTVAPLQTLYPIGAGPSSDPRTSNVFRLPHGFLRQAASDPKGGANPFLGAAKGNWREDWVYEANALVSASPGPIMLRYVADFVDVMGMEATFCEMLATRLALELAPRLLRDESVRTAITNARALYRDTRAAAVGLNAIEIGPIDLDMSDYIACRF